MGKASTVIDCLKKLLMALLVAFVLIIIGFITIKCLGGDSIFEERSEVVIEDHTELDLDLSPATKE